jgi:hypothetical protein
MRFLLILLAALSVAFAQETCGICNLLVASFETYGTKGYSRADLLKEVTGISAQVCNELPETIISNQECTSFVHLYAPYAIDLLLSEAKPSSICGLLELCTIPGEKDDSKIVFPVITEDAITYSLEEKFDKDATFNYKLFLGNAEHLSDVNYELVVHVGRLIDCEVSVKITNRTDYVETTVESPKNRTVHISKPGRGVYYYITVTAKVTGDKPSFFFNSTERNETVGYWILASHHHINSGAILLIICMTFASFCLFCLCITRCIFHRRKCTSSQRDAQSMESGPVSINAQPMVVMEGMERQQATAPMMALFYPQNLPMAYGYPQYLPLQQEE